MSALKEPGSYKAKCQKWRMAEKQGGKPQFEVQYACTEWWDGSEWKPFKGEDNEITGYYHLVKRDGALNEFAINSLRDALGWKGGFKALANGDYDMVQIVVDTDDRGKLAVKFTNNINSTIGRRKEVAADALDALDAKYGAGLAALSSGKDVDLSIEEEDIPF